MTPGLEYLIIAWAVVTVLFMILLFYRSMLTRQRPTSFSSTNLHHRWQRISANCLQKCTS